MYLNYHFLHLLMRCILLVLAQGQTSESLDFCFNSTLEGFKLNTTVLRTKNVPQLIHCIIQCVSEPCCRSINYKKTLALQNEPNCEMLHNVVYNTSDNLLEINSSYDYAYLTNPRKKYNASCLVLEGNLQGELKSCASIYEFGQRKDGVYTVNPDGLESFQVWCDMKTDYGGWAVFQRRLNGSVNFFRGWQDYKDGFGDLNGEFWLGLEKIQRLSKSGEHILRVDLADFDNTTAYRAYESFSVAPESDDYRLNIANFAGNAGDSLGYHNGMKFSTNDRDNDKWSNGNCAEQKKGGWWYRYCLKANLNGQYLQAGERLSRGVLWREWKNDFRSLKKTELKIRPTETV